jgi:hypothetical protein
LNSPAHDRLLEKVAQRIDDADVMRLLKVMLKASGKMGVPQGGVISPLLSNLFLNEDRMRERAREVTRNGKYTYIEYARLTDDLVILIDAYKRHDWLIGAVNKRLREEFDKLRVEISQGGGVALSQVTKRCRHTASYSGEIVTVETMWHSARKMLDRALINAKGVSNAPAERSEPVAHLFRAVHQPGCCH